MKYKVNIQYKENVVTITTSNKKNSGDWSLGNFLTSMRITSGIDFFTLHMLSDISENNIIKIENEEIDITQESLKALQKVFKFPKKIISLGTDPDKPLWSQRLTELRNKEKYTQKELSDKIGIAQTTYSGYETGRNEPDIETLIKLADIYKVDLNYLMGRY